MSDDRNFWGVIGDVAGQAAETIPRWQQSKLDARHKAHLDALAQRHAQEQYDAQMRGLDIREQQALAAQHAAEARESYNQSRLDQIDAQLREQGRHNVAAEGISAAREERTTQKQPPNYLGIIPQRAEEMRAKNTLQRQRESTYTDEWGDRKYQEPTTPLISDSAALERAYGENVGQFPQWNVSPDSIRTGVGLPVARPTPPAPRWGTIGTPMTGSYRPGVQQAPPPNDGSLTDQEYQEFVALWRQKNGQ